MKFGHKIIAQGKEVILFLLCFRIGMNPIQNDGALSLLTAMKNNMDSAIEKMLLNNVVVNLETQELAKFLLGQRPGLTIVCTMSKLSGKHGDQLDQPHGDNRKKKQLIYILKKYVEDKNYRVVDLFNQFDKDKSMSVTREEFRIGLKSIGVPMTDAQLTDLIDILDEDGDGEIDYGEFTWINEVE